PDACGRTGRTGSPYSIADGRRIESVPAVRPATALYDDLRVASSTGVFAKLARHTSRKRRFHEARVGQRRADDTRRRTNSRHDRAKSKNYVARDCISDQFDRGQHRPEQERRTGTSPYFSYDG